MQKYCSSRLNSTDITPFCNQQPARCRQPSHSRFSFSTCNPINHHIAELRSNRLAQGMMLQALFSRLSSLSDEHRFIDDWSGWWHIFKHMCEQLFWLIRMNMTPFDFDFDWSAETRTLSSILLTLLSVIPILYRYHATENSIVFFAILGSSVFLFLLVCLSIFFHDSHSTA